MLLSLLPKVTDVGPLDSEFLMHGLPKRESFFQKFLISLKKSQFGWHSLSRGVSLTRLTSSMAQTKAEVEVLYS